MANNFIVKDSGERQQFETGSKRDTDTNKPDYSLLSHHANRRTAIHLVKGAAKYGRRNWELGQPVSRFLASAMRHIEDFRSGDRTEDHLAAARFNIDAMMHMEEEAAAGKVAYQKMLDLDFYPAQEEMNYDWAEERRKLDAEHEAEELALAKSGLMRDSVLYVLHHWKRFTDASNPKTEGLIPGEITRGLKRAFGLDVKTDEKFFGLLNYLSNKGLVGERGRDYGSGIQTFYYAIEE